MNSFKYNYKPLVFICAVIFIMCAVRCSTGRDYGNFSEIAVMAYDNNYDKSFIFPLDGAVTSVFAQRPDPFGTGGSEFHHGIDISASESKTIYASFSGTVTTAAYHESYGKYIIIDHGEGIETLYAHCSSIYVKRGDRVRKGEIIAKAGSTGRSTAPHLHFEVRINGEQIDPMTLLFGKEAVSA